MGKTVQIDDDVLAAAEKIAAERGSTPGEVISELRAARADAAAAGAAGRKERLLRPSDRGEVVTSRAGSSACLRDADFEDAGLPPRD